MCRAGCATHPGGIHAKNCFPTKCSANQVCKHMPNGAGAADCMGGGVALDHDPEGGIYYKDKDKMPAGKDRCSVEGAVTQCMPENVLERPPSKVGKRSPGTG